METEDVRLCQLFDVWRWVWGLEAAALGAKANSAGMGDGGAGAGASRLKAETDEPMVAARFHLVWGRRGKIAWSPADDRCADYSVYDKWMKLDEACATGEENRLSERCDRQKLEQKLGGEGWLVVEVGEREKLVSDSPSTGHWSLGQEGVKVEHPRAHHRRWPIASSNLAGSVPGILSGAAHPTTKQWRLNSPGPGIQLSRPIKN